MGERQVKNIAEALTVYEVRLDNKALALVTPIVPKPPTSYARRGRLAATAAALLLGLIGTVLWLWQPWTAFSPGPPVERFAYPLPDKPSIAVLPFINTSRDAEQDHLAEGLTDGLITELSKVSGMFVIARHSVFALGNGIGSIQRVAKEFGVHFVLEGTLQRAELRLRIQRQFD